MPIRAGITLGKGNALFIWYSLFGQWAVLLYLIGETALVIYAQTTNGGIYPRGCSPMGYAETVSPLLFSLFGFVCTFLFQRVHGMWPLYFVWTLFVVVCSFAAGDFVFFLFAALCVLTLSAFLWARFGCSKGAAGENSLASSTSGRGPEEY